MAQLETFKEIMGKMDYVPEEEYNELQEKEETKEEEVVEEKKETTEEAKTDEKTEETKTEEQDKTSEDETEKTEEKAEEKVEKPVDFYTEFKNKTGREIQSDEDLNKFFEQFDEYGNELKTRKEKDPYYETLEANFKDVVERFNPITQHGSKEAWEKYETAKQIGKGKNQYVVSEILNKDLGGMDNLRVASYNIMFNAPDISLDDAKRSIIRKLGVNIKEWESQEEKTYDVNNPELTAEQKVDLSVLASEARDRFDTLKTSVKLPDFPDALKDIEDKTKQRQEFDEKLKTGWGDTAKEIAKTPPSIEVDGFKVDYNKFGKGFTSKAAEWIMKDAIQRGIEPTKENIESQSELFKMVSVYTNLDKIVKAYAEEKTTELQKKLDDLVHNSKEIKTEEAPDTGPKTKQDEINEAARQLVEEKGL